MPRSTHDSLPALDEQLSTIIQDGWEQEVLSQLPADFEQQAHRLGAFVRVRGLACASDLLRGLLAFVLCARSLRQLGAWAVLIGLANLSHVAWQKRLRRARAWLLWLLAQRLAVPPMAALPESSRILLVDATRLKQPAGTGDDWRVHLAYDLLGGRLADVRISDRHTAEGFTLFDWRPGDIVIADRGYCRRPQVAAVLLSGAHILLRLAPQQFPLQEGQGRSLDVMDWLKEARADTLCSPVCFVQGSHTFSGRLIAHRLTAEAAERARKRVQRKANKQQRELREVSLFLAGWLLLFSSLPEANWSAEQMLSLYRARWQIELVIKRMKQLLKLAQLRGSSVATNEATLLALLLCWALQQQEADWARQVLAKAQATLDEPQALTLSSWGLLSLCVQTLCFSVLGYWTASRLHACWPWLLRFVSSRGRRAQQESTMRRFLQRHLAVESSSLLFSCSSA